MTKQLRILCWSIVLLLAFAVSTPLQAQSISPTLCQSDKIVNQILSVWYNALPEPDWKDYLENDVVFIRSEQVGADHLRPGDYSLIQCVGYFDVLDGDAEHHVWKQPYVVRRFELYDMERSSGKDLFLAMEALTE